MRLTQPEVLDRSKALADAHAKLDKQRDYEAEIKKDLKSAREKIEHEIADLARVVRNEREPRPVQVEVRGDYVQGTATEVRMDTGEVVIERMLTVEELERVQGQLPLEPPPGAAPLIQEESNELGESGDEKPDDIDAEAARWGL